MNIHSENRAEYDFSEGMKGLLRDYHTFLLDNHYSPVEVPDELRGLLSLKECEACDHALWMIEEMLGRRRPFHEVMANRWLGFVQAVLWISGHRGISDLRRETRKMLGLSAPP